jgi:sulfopyruvate decarboxylase TPP-binding subunit
MTRPTDGGTDTVRGDTVAAADAQNWPNLIFEKLREFDVRHVTYVPDAGHARLIELCQAEHDMEPTVLTTEEEGIGILAGAWLGGERGVLLMQSSGVGNCINTLSLRKGVRLPLADDRHHARRVGRSESLASSDGPDHSR